MILPEMTDVFCDITLVTDIFIRDGYSLIKLDKFYKVQTGN